MRRLFEDLARPRDPARSLGVGSVSLAFHVAGLTLALLVPVLRVPALPDPGTALPTAPLVPVFAAAPSPAAPVPVRGRRSGRATPRGATGRETASPGRAPVAIVVDEERPPDPDAPSGPGQGPASQVGAVGPEGGGPGEDDPSAVRVASGPLRVGTGIDPPRKLEHVVPVYPELARRAGVQGTVVIECVIDPAGHVAQLHVESGHPLLREAAVDAVRRWRYSPTRLNGVPVAVLLTVTVEFGLGRR